MSTAIAQWATRKLECIQAYQTATKATEHADDRLRELLRARYGKRAGDMRYRPAETVEIGEAMRVFVAACEVRQAAWLAYLECR